MTKRSFTFLKHKFYNNWGFDKWGMMKRRVHQMAAVPGYTNFGKLWKGIYQQCHELSLFSVMPLDQTLGQTASQRFDHQHILGFTLFILITGAPSWTGKRARHRGTNSLRSVWRLNQQILEGCHSPCPPWLFRAKKEHQKWMEGPQGRGAWLQERDWGMHFRPCQWIHWRSQEQRGSSPDGHPVTRGLKRFMSETFSWVNSIKTCVFPQLWIVFRI